MSNHESIPLTASELGYLWTGYAINEMSEWFLAVFREQAQDKDVKEVYTYAIKVSNKIINTRSQLLSNDGYPIPVGFSDKDIDMNSPPLFSDRFLLHYLCIGARLGLEFHARSLALATRLDVRQYHTECLQSCIQLNDKIVDIMLKKGMDWRSPHLVAPKHPEKIQKISYLHGWIGDTRPQNSFEMANLYHIIELLVLIETLCTAFTQTADSEDVRDLLEKGCSIINHHNNELTELLKKDDLPIPPSFVAEITNSKDKIFSDRIMLCHLSGLFGSLLSQYGFAVGCVIKNDMAKTYLTLIANGGLFAEKMTRFLIEKEWLEKIP